MNYGPFDLLFKVVRLSPVYMILALLQENLRARCVFQGLQMATKAYPGAVIIVLLAGVINGRFCSRLYHCSISWYYQY